MRQEIFLKVKSLTCITGSDEHLIIINLGYGYRLNLEEKTYMFPMFERAPPEGYFMQDYVTDFASFTDCSNQ